MSEFIVGVSSLKTHMEEFQQKLTEKFKTNPRYGTATIIDDFTGIEIDKVIIDRWALK